MVNVKTIKQMWKERNATLELYKQANRELVLHREINRRLNEFLGKIECNLVKEMLDVFKPKNPDKIKSLLYDELERTGNVSFTEFISKLNRRMNNEN